MFEGLVSSSKAVVVNFRQKLEHRLEVEASQNYDGAF